MKHFTFLSFLFIVCISCESEKITPREQLEGEWKLMRRFPLVSSYRCLDCPDFNYDKSLFSVNFDNANTANGKINLLIFESKFMISDTKEEDNRFTGQIVFDGLKILNKPPETEEDTKIKQSLENLRFFTLTTNISSKYDYLSFYTNQDELMYVRKK